MTLIEIAPGIVLDRDEVLACEAQARPKEEGKSCLIVTFKGREYALSFYCDDPVAAVKKLWRHPSPRQQSPCTK